MELMRYASLVVVGPGDREVERLADLCDSIAFHEPGPGLLIIVDDAPTDRRLSEQLRAGPELAGSRLSVMSVHHPRRMRGRRYQFGVGICSAVMLGLKQAAAHASAAPFVLKLDTDSLVIAPFADRLRDLFASDPTLGVAGAFRTTPNGTPRDFGPNAHAIAVGLNGKPTVLQRLRQALRGKSNNILASVVSRARAGRFGYEPGEHCMGGGYAMSHAFITAMQTAGYLDDPMRWEHVDLAEDVMVGLHARAVDLDLRDDVGEGQVFGVRYKGLPFPPDELVRRRYAVIHAVKNDPDVTEVDIRTFFKARRAAWS